MAQRTTPCERCGAPAVEIRMLTGEQDLVLRSCSTCDHRSWLQAGRRAAIGDVLDAVATTGRRRSA